MLRHHRLQSSPIPPSTPPHSAATPTPLQTQSTTYHQKKTHQNHSQTMCFSLTSMFKSHKITEQAKEPKPMSTSEPPSSTRNSEPPSQSHIPFSFDQPSTSLNYSSSYDCYKNSWQSSNSSRTSLSSLRESLPENPHIYDFSEIISATNNFLSKRHSSSSSSSSWRCTIRGNDAIVFQRKFRRQIQISELRERLLLICKSHHTSLIKLSGASVSGNYIYFVYDYVHGSNLANCLRNPKNPNFTVLSNWMSRVQIATDLAHGLDYIHHSTGLSLNFVHNHLKSTSIIVTDSSLNAKICHFGTSDLCGEIKRNDEIGKDSAGSELKRMGSGALKFEGTRGYMSPEFQSNGVATQKSDVYAFGVILFELLTGEEPLKYRIDENGGGYRRISVIETAREAVESGGAGVRRWVDKRLRDSYPVEVVEKLTRVGLECVEGDPDKRPDMGWVVGRISKLYLESKTWVQKMGVPADFTANFSISVDPR